MDEKKTAPEVEAPRRISKWPKDVYLWGFEINGPYCGRDSLGVFHCACGKCRPLRFDVSEDCEDRSYNGRDGRADGDGERNQKSVFLRACL